MALRKIATGQLLSTYSRHRSGYQTKLKKLNQTYLIHTRYVYRSTLMKGLEIVSNDDLKIKKVEGKLPMIGTREKNKPLLLLFPWMLCNPKHSDKFVNMYLSKGFDVMVVSCLTSEIIRWNQGAEKKASNLLEFLHQNEAYQPIIFHGFSIGNGLWTSVLWQISQNVERYGPTADRVKGQIMDSVPQSPDVIRNVCYAIFPKNRTMGEYLYRIVSLILDVTATYGLTSAYERNNVLFNNPPFKIPILLFCSEGDVFSELERNLAAFENWKSLGLNAHIKCWEKSKHVGHFRLHREEYVEAINSFFKSIGIEAKL